MPGSRGSRRAPTPARTSRRATTRRPTERATTRAPSPTRQAAATPKKTSATPKKAAAVGVSAGSGGPSSRDVRCPPMDHGPRLACLRAALSQRKLDHALITNPLDVGYLTGFMGGDSYLYVGPREAVIISDFRFQEELEEVASIARAFIRTGSIASATAQVLREAGAGRCAVQPEHLTLADRGLLEAAIKESATLVPERGLISPMRAIKDAGEIARIRRAIQIQERALVATLADVRPGQTEREVAARLEFEMRSRGSSETGFPSIVAARANGSLPHYRAGDVKLAKNQGLLIDWGATFQGYRGDMTRTFALGKWPAKLREIFEIVREAHERAVSVARAGVTNRVVDAAARDHIAHAGYGEAFGHGLGHGLGLNVHEDPRVSHMAPEAPLRVGEVITIEPGIYLPGIGGVRLENDYVVTESGVENLCTLPLTLDWCTLS